MLPHINKPFEYASIFLGATPDELKLVTSFFISFPISGFFRCIPDNKPALKNLFTIGVSCFYLIGLFDLWDGLRTLAISSTFVYLAAKYINGAFMPWIVFVFVMAHLSISHLARQFVDDPGVVDISGAQMILAIKLTSFAWNIADGRLPEKCLSKFQKEKAIRKLPSILDFCGFIMFFPSLFAGPAFDYVDYKRWLDMAIFEELTEKDSSKDTLTMKTKISGNLLPATWKAASGIFWILLFLKLSAIYYPNFLIGNTYLTYSLIRRVWVLYMLSFTSRLKYYGVWALTEAACIFSGLGYNGIDPMTGKVSWDRLRHVDPIGVETAQNTRAYLANWNINTNNWLRNYVYLRVTPRGKKPGFGATFATFVTSAFWHGFYPGYYLTFVLASFTQTVAKNFRRHLRPFFLDPSTSKPTSLKPIYDIFSYLVTQLAFSFLTAPFIFLTLETSLTVWSRVYYYGVAGTIISTIFFSSPGKAYLVKKLNHRTLKERPVLQPTHDTDSAVAVKSSLEISPVPELKPVTHEKSTMENQSKVL
ncbi:Lysophospholipid acyltransferase [Podosphaera aphanis]|nr:Lysophospholipid acyltransferase [Podosphaera aphanis]